MALGSDQLFAKAQDVVATCIGCVKEDIEPTTDLVATYRLDSLDVLDLGLEIEKRFAVHLSEADSSRLRTLEDIVHAVEAATECTPA
jgi:acyl carrier protein